MQLHTTEPSSKLVVLLGPTNTGKTHRAIARMLEHSSGMIGLPLRLLAREVYDRLTREIGEQAVALVTGEEKRIGARTRYWVCTVEAMPVSQEVDFLAVDEVQLAAHPERGHVFTDRLLHARGRLETWFLGADTMRPLLRSLVPTATFDTLPRLSSLVSRGPAPLAELPPRSALVAFSVPSVYRLAEQLRQRRGGAAIVLGALSPRARNAQVALYEAGEVDYLVATDAIGMGLNLAIRHVAFASLDKFDGKEQRPLSPAELAQIAGRAGRHLEDGSFGSLAPLAMSDGLRRAIEEHRFASVRKLMFRNSELCTDSIAELLASLRRPPALRHFTLMSRAPDVEALERLSEDDLVQQRAQGRSAVELLWEACQIPDYRQWVPELHADLVKQIFLQLSGPSGVLDADWLARSLAHLDDTRGDLDALTWRLASIRTWTYIAGRERWLPDAAHWVERTRELEDRLSDALHVELVRRFIARPRSSLEPAARTREVTAASPSSLATPFAALEGLRTRLLGADAEPHNPERWLEDLIAAPHERFRLDERGRIWDGERYLGQLARGSQLLRPELRLAELDLGKGQQARLSRRLLALSRDWVQELVGPLEAVNAGGSPPARGIAYQLQQSLGGVPSRAVEEQRAALSESDRQLFARLGVRLGREVTFLRSSVEPRFNALRVTLAAAASGSDVDGLWQLVQQSSFVPPRGLSEAQLLQLGFILIGGRAIAFDVADRLERELFRRSRSGPFRLPHATSVGLEGQSRAEIASLARALGYRRGEDGRYRKRRRRKRLPPRSSP